MKLLVLAFLALVNVQPAVAGNESHGGDVVVCDGKEPVVLDYYHAALKGIGEDKPKIPDISNWSEERVILFFSNKLKNYVVRFEALNAGIKLGALSTWAEADLKEVDDSDEPYFLPKGCARKQGAVRQGNQMFVDPTYVNLLSPAQKGMLYIHELLYYVAQRHGQKNSVSTRNLIRLLLREDTKDERLFDAIHHLGSIVWWWEMLVGNTPCYERFQGSGEFNPDNICFDRASAAERTLHLRYTSGSAIVPMDPAILTCSTNGLECTITQSIKWKDNDNFVLGWQEGTLKFADGLRKLIFTNKEGTKTKEYYRVSTGPWPFPIH